MFEYAVEALHMSPAEAYVRLRAAKLAREFPLVLSMLARNELHLSAVKLLAPHLTQANHVDVLERARCKSKRAVELIVAQLAPKPDVPSVVRKLPAARAAASPALQAAAEFTSAQLVRELPAAQAAASPAVQATSELTLTQPSVREFRLETPSQVTTPLSPGRYKVQFTATQTLHDKLQQLQDLMRHRIPDGELSMIIERAADLLIEQEMKQRFAQTKKTSASVARPGKAWSRHVPRAVRRAVYARDAGQCTFVSLDGRRCGSRQSRAASHRAIRSRWCADRREPQACLPCSQCALRGVGLRPDLHAGQELYSAEFCPGTNSALDPSSGELTDSILSVFVDGFAHRVGQGAGAERLL
ncbi:MAG TPA: hypothetical protein VJV78_12980 [Polyangiales bacterium]|nr:hypothetical protein [Polyangiales bacterium]